MKCDKLFKGTTPSFTFNLEIPLKNIKTIIVTFNQLGTNILEKRNDEIIILEEGIKIKLTQEETFLFSSKYNTTMQVRISYKNTSTIASEEKKV